MITRPAEGIVVLNVAQGGAKNLHRPAMRGALWPIALVYRQPG